MAQKGGARNRSGPPPNPNSARSAKRGLAFRLLPVEGFGGEAPVWPLPEQSEREAEVWAAAWRTPQACAWVDEPWRWYMVAMWCRWTVRLEQPDAAASLSQVVIRFADQIGLTPAGLRDNGWAISSEVVDDEQDKKPGSSEAARSRLRVV